MVDIDPYAIAQRLLSFSNESARKNGEYTRLYEMRKPVLYTIAEQCNSESAAAKEQFGYRSDEYKAHVNKMADAQIEGAIAKGKLEAERTRIDLIRTVSANEREINRNLP